MTMCEACGVGPVGSSMILLTPVLSVCQLSLAELAPLYSYASLT
jgi:hypothetical protein